MITSVDKHIHNNQEGREALSQIPNLDRRIDNFMEWLLKEPCCYPRNVEVFGELKQDPEKGGCMIISKSRQMCPACRLRLAFFHTVFNGEAYDSTLGVEDK